MAMRFGSKEHRDFLKGRRQQKINKAELFNIDACLEKIKEFIVAVGTMEPIASKIVLEAMGNCRGAEGMESNRRIFKDYLESR